jgi:hypothetical protein
MWFDQLHAIQKLYNISNYQDFEGELVYTSQKILYNFRIITFSNKVYMYMVTSLKWKNMTL